MTKVILTQRASHRSLTGEILDEWYFTLSDMEEMVKAFKESTVKPYLYNGHMKLSDGRRDIIGTIEDLSIDGSKEGEYAITAEINLLQNNGDIIGYPSPELSFKISNNTDTKVKYGFRIKGVAIVDSPSFEDVDEINVNNSTLPVDEEQPVESMGYFSAIIEEEDNNNNNNKDNNTMDKNTSIKELFTAFLDGDMEAKAGLIEALKDEAKAEEFLTDLALAHDPKQESNTQEEEQPKDESSNTDEGKGKDESTEEQPNTEEADKGKGKDEASNESTDEDSGKDKEGEEEFSDVADLACINDYIISQGFTTATMESIMKMVEAMKAGMAFDEAAALLELRMPVEVTETEAEFSAVNTDDLAKAFFKQSRGY